MTPTALRAALSEQTARTSVREAVIDLLRHFGMTTVFGNPGSTELPLYRGWPADFRYVLGLQEAAVVAMADGYAQATHNAAFVNLHSAAGVGHGLGSVFTAYRNQTPLVITAGQQTRSMLPTEPFLFAHAAAEFPKPYIKWGIEPARPEDVPAAIARAYYMAMQPPRGPTFVSVPVDDWDQMAAKVLPRDVSDRLRPDPERLAAVSKALARSRRPAFVVGAGVDRDRAWDLAIQLAERFDASVWASPKSSRCSFPENHRLFAGFLASERAAIAAALAEHDFVLALGAPAFTYHVETGGPFLGKGTDLFQIVDDPSLASWAPGGASIVASLDLAIADLIAAAPPARPTTSAPRRSVLRVEAAETISVRYLMQTLADVRPRDSILVEEAPSSRPALQDHLPITIADGFFATASGGLGFGLPAAVGVALARPAQRVIALVGDGSIMYAIQALWSAAQHRLPLTIVVVRNGGYEALRGLSKRFGVDNPVGVDLPALDFVLLAQGQGCQGFRVTDAADLHRVLTAACAAAESTLVEVVVA